MIKKVSFLIIISLVVSFPTYSQDLYINEFMASNSITIADPDFGEYSDWLEIYNAGDSTINLYGYYLTDDLSDKTKWKINENINLETDDFVLFWADDRNQGKHTNFKLSKSGEEIGLYSADGIAIDEITYGEQITDKSYGRYPDGSDNWYIFVETTPENFNSTDGVENILPDPTFSIDGGFYSVPQILTLSSSIDSTEIYFTLDGSPPTKSDSLYSEVITIPENCVIRAKSFKDNYLPSSTITNTFFIDEDIILPVVSLVTNPDNFFDDEIGIYVEGTNGISGYCTTEPRNWNQDWERPISIEFFEKDKNLGFKIDAGVKIGGGCSRLYNQKSLSFYIRRKYGEAKLHYQLFPQKKIHEFNNFMLRSSAQDWYRSMFRSGMIQEVVKRGLEIDYREYRPTIVFLNGEYWGIHNLREKMNEHYLEENFGVDPDKVDMIKGQYLINGNKTHYNNLFSFINNNDMSTNSNYNYVKTLIDINQYIDYQIAEIYIANLDWPANNMKMWRPQTSDGKWRWLFFDLDLSFGGNSQGNYDSNILEQATATDGPNWPNPPWSTLLFRKLLENENFKNEFIQRFAVHINTTFDSTTVVNIIDSLATDIAPEIPRHKIRWENSISYDGGLWSNNIETMRKFARKRPAFARQHIIDKFGLSGAASLKITNENSTGGKVIIHNSEISENNCELILFKNVPVKIEAKCNPGYRFTGWQGVMNDSCGSISFLLTSDSEITVTFAKDTLQSTNIVINEINYNSSSVFETGDWIELYNNTDEHINIAEWVFKDDDNGHSFVFPNDTYINARKYLVLCRDTTAFQYYNPNIKNIIGDCDFGLSGSGELIRLYDNEMNIIDSLTYDDNSPWPVKADGNGFTLELNNPNYDNSLSKNWFANSLYGSPGKINTVYSKVNENIISTNFQLSQNYPNPFNTTTTISYSLEKESKVNLKIYNIQGREVKTLVSDTQLAGTKTLIWNGKDNQKREVSSGIYFYVLQIEGKIESKKMVLLK
ncbi:MAG: CotH kinase family protein [Candidatus Marinimicrobia bacterium]|nr:CotH kinase family protein [Candidatus Neomarinimicrobiota bacterium]